MRPPPRAHAPHLHPVDVLCRLVTGCCAWCMVADAPPAVAPGSCLSLRARASSDPCPPCPPCLPCPPPLPFSPPPFAAILGSRARRSSTRPTSSSMCRRTTTASFTWPPPPRRRRRPVALARTFSAARRATDASRPPSRYVSPAPATATVRRGAAQRTADHWALSIDE